jgi:hypothetical protein
MTTSNKKGPSVIGAMTLCGEILLAGTISVAAILSSGVGLPSTSAQAAPAPLVQAAAQVVAED